MSERLILEFDKKQLFIENTQWNDFDLAVAFYENQVFSFSSTGKNFAITKKDMTKRFGRLIAACARLRNATIMHRDYKDCISYQPYTVLTQAVALDG